jgi:hypothetical protein
MKAVVRATSPRAGSSVDDLQWKDRRTELLVQRPVEARHREAVARGLRDYRDNNRVTETAGSR